VYNNLNNNVVDWFMLCIQLLSIDADIGVNLADNLPS